MYRRHTDSWPLAEDFRNTFLRSARKIGPRLLYVSRLRAASATSARRSATGSPPCRPAMIRFAAANRAASGVIVGNCPITARRRLASRPVPTRNCATNAASPSPPLRCAPKPRSSPHQSHSPPDALRSQDSILRLVSFSPMRFPLNVSTDLTAVSTGYPRPINLYQPPDISDAQ